MKYLHSYFASKHAVVSMPRTLGSNETFKETGVKVWSFFHIFPFSFSPQVQCICPSFADTAILNDPDGGNANRTMLEKTYGILTVEEVSEGFMQLVENCGNGAAVIVFKVISPPWCLLSKSACQLSTFRALRQWSSMTSASLLFMGWPSCQWHSTR